VYRRAYRRGYLGQSSHAKGVVACRQQAITELSALTKKVAKSLGLGTVTVQRIAKELVERSTAILSYNV
jgi:hypothetical protein